MNSAPGFTCLNSIRPCAENFQADLVDLTHAYSMLDRTCKRLPKPIMEQNLLKTTARGYEVAVRRGDVCLVRNYLEELQRWSKQQYRYEAVCQGELLATGEDADLELHHQPLPLQKNSCCKEISLLIHLQTPIG